MEQEKIEEVLDLASSIVVERKPELKLKARKVSLNSYWLTAGEMRLDASFYTLDVAIARRLLRESGYSTMPLETLVEDVFYPPRSKRYLTNEKNGVPYLTASEFRYLRYQPKFILPSKIPKIENWRAKEGWILLTRSGTVGIPMLITRRFEKYIFSEHLIRIVPKSNAFSGFLYAYLSSWLGQALITKDQFGAVVEEIEPHHVESLPIPDFPEDIRREVHTNVLKVFRLRDKARHLLEKAEQMLLDELAIPETKKTLSQIKVFSVHSSNLKLRLDASFHNPMAKSVHERLMKGKYTVERIDNNLGQVFIPPRFKRIYVKKEYGVPFLSGSNIAQIKSYNLKYLSKKATKKIERWIIRSGWVLVTCSGTIGRVALAPKEWDGWAVSQHVLRIIPNVTKVHPGYLTAFLSSIYGYQQIISKIYGGVVDELAEDDMKDVLVPLPPMDIQEKIGKMVVKAFELKELANKIEDDTIKTLEDMFLTHKRLEINEEYLKEINAYADSFELIGNEKFRKSLEELESGETTSFDEFKKEHGF